MPNPPNPADASAPTCGICELSMSGVHPDLLHEFTHNGKPAHEGCYYELLGAGLERMPICSPVPPKLA